MSAWSQVAMIFRIDYIKRNCEGELDFEAFFGKTLDYDDSHEKWEDWIQNPEQYLPSGSEGTLEMSLWENPHESHADRYTISIFGSLRDHEEEDVKNLIKWFDDKCNDERISVRQAVITIDNSLVGNITKSV